MAWQNEGDLSLCHHASAPLWTRRLTTNCGNHSGLPRRGRIELSLERRAREGKREQLPERKAGHKRRPGGCPVTVFPFSPQCHEFTDELTFNEALGAVSLGGRTSRSTSVSSQPAGPGGLLSSCCPRRAKRRAIRLANSTASVSRGSMQELDTLAGLRRSPVPQR